MANFYEPTLKQKLGWAKWVKKRPRVIRELGKRFKPWTLYRLHEHRVFIIGFEESGTVIVGVSGRFNAVLFERQAFGVPPDDLTECDLPDEGELVGVMIPEPSEEDFAAMREMMGVRHKHEVN